MAWDNRSYYRDVPPAHMGVGGMGNWPVTTWLMGLCIGVFVVDAVLARIMGRPEVVGNGPLTDWGNLSAAKAVFSGQVWRLVTFQFLHIGLLHLVFNLFVIYFFGRMIEPALGSRRYLAYYLLSGLGGGALFLLLVWLGGVVPNASRVPGLLVVDIDSPLVGASAGCYGVLVAAAVLYPHETVRLWLPPISLTIRWLAIILIGLSAFFVLVNNMPGHGGEAAHLGGAVAGYLLMRFPRTLAFAEGSRGFRLPFLPKNDWASKQARADKQREKEEAEVDRILDKVRANGLHSLSRGEKKALQQATKRSAARDAS
ncbi:MAG: rhomboid family intramembrane serine protease [Planctomycetota bacterium]|nr:rhomboid family intramembrane serine protease [Planctomycetota bacterium]